MRPMTPSEIKEYEALVKNSKQMTLEDFLEGGGRMKDGKIHIPARKKETVRTSQVVKISPEAYNVLVDIYNETYLSMKDLVSTIILQSAENIVFDKEE